MLRNAAPAYTNGEAQDTAVGDGLAELLTAIATDGGGTCIVLDALDRHADATLREIATAKAALGMLAVAAHGLATQADIAADQLDQAKREVIPVRNRR
jgi:hypothetical protein